MQPLPIPGVGAIDGEQWQRVRHLKDALTHAGLITVCAGGAARDIMHGRVPKDYDLIPLDCDYSKEHLELDDPSTIQAFLVDLGYAAILFHSYNSGEIANSRIKWVLKVHTDGGEIDIIEYKHGPKTAAEVAEYFDCELNQVAFDANWEPYRTHASVEFVEGQTLKMLPHCDFPEKRMAYLQAKYPQYNLVPA